MKIVHTIKQASDHRIHAHKQARTQSQMKACTQSGKQARKQWGVK
jgi:hypothetical protein